MTRRDVGAPSGSAVRGEREACRGKSVRLRADVVLAVAIAAAATVSFVGPAGAVTEPPWRIDRMGQPRASSGGDQRLRGEVADLRAALQARDAEAQASLAQIDRTIAAANHRFAASVEDVRAAHARMVARFEIFSAALIAVIAVLCAWIMRLQQQVHALERRRIDSATGLAGPPPRAFEPYGSSGAVGAGEAAVPPGCLPLPAARLPRGGPTTRPAARRGGRTD